MDEEILFKVGIIIYVILNTIVLGLQHRRLNILQNELFKKKYKLK